MSAARAPAAPSLLMLLEMQRDALDGLVAEAWGGVRNPAHYDALETRATAIAERLRAAFREHRG